MNRLNKIAFVGGLCLLSTTAFASSAGSTLDIFVNGKYIGHGITFENTTWVPLRAVSEALGASVTYSPAATKDGVPEVIIGNESIPADADAASSPPPSSSGADAQPAANFTGDTSKNTEPFTVRRRWRIEWDTKPNAGDGPSNFMMDVVNANDGSEFDNPANVIGSHKATSQEYKAGTYYLKIETGQSYNISIYNE